MADLNKLAANIKSVASRGYVQSKFGVILHEDDRFYTIRDGADVTDFTVEDLVDVTDEDLVEKEVLARLGNRRAMVLAVSPEFDRVIEEGEIISAALDDTAQVIGYKIPVVSYTKESMLRGFVERSGILVKAGYAATTGRNFYEAYSAMGIMEKAIATELGARVLGGTKALNPVLGSMERVVYMGIYSKKEQEYRDSLKEHEETAEDEREVEIYPPEEKRCRELLVTYGKRLRGLNLVQGSWGNLSVKLNDRYMIITPSGVAYDKLTPGDMVKVDIDTLEYDEEGKKPSVEKALHAYIYAARPDVGAVIHTHARYCSAFAAAHKPLQIENPHLQKFAGELIYIADYAVAGTYNLAKNAVEALGPRFGVLLANHGMVCCGKDPATAMEVCEAMEAGAREYIEARK